MLSIIRNCRDLVYRKLNFVANLTAENLALRQQLIVLNRKQSRPNLKERDRLFWMILSRIWRGWRSAILIVQPDTVVRCHNAYVERLNSSSRRECTDHVIVLNENHLRRILRAYFEYYNEDTTHLGLYKETPMGRPVSNRASPSAKLVEMPWVGGLHHRYKWSEAA